MSVSAASIQFFIKFMNASIVQFKSTLIFISPTSGTSIKIPFCWNNSYKLSDARERIVKTSVGFLSSERLKAKDSDTTVTGRSIGGPVRVLKNKMAREYLALEKRNATLEELETVTIGGLRRAVLEGDVERGSVMMGQVAGMVHEIRPLRQIFEELYNGGKAVLEQVHQEWR